MDILIKNMEMPKEGGLVIEITKHGQVAQLFKDGSLLRKGIKAIELPPHGDLKDETDIIHRIEKIADADLAQDIIGEILASPTIVEATE